MDGRTKEGGELVRLLVVAAEELFRRGLSALLAADPGVKVVGVTRDPAAAKAVAVNVGADAVLVDLDGRTGAREGKLIAVLTGVPSGDERAGDGVVPGGDHDGRHQLAGDGMRALTRRQLEVLCLVAQGLNNKDVAEALFLAENTVKNHVRNILAKLGVRTRIQAAMVAVREGLIDPQQLGPTAQAPGGAGGAPVH